jgi:hypothetical protein
LNYARYKRGDAYAAVNATEDLKDDEKDLQKTYIGISDFMKSDYPLESVTSKKAS